MNKLNEKIVKYITLEILPLYHKNDKAHQIEHAEYVIKRILELGKDYDVDFNMLYVIAAYHDCGSYIDRENHEKKSAEILYNDSNLKEFFSINQLTIMKEAVEDHRSSLEGQPRSIYGKLIKAADMNTDVNMPFRRTYLYSVNYYPEFTTEQHIERAFAHLNEKFGVNGYAKIYIKDQAYEQYLEDLKILLADKKSFVKRFKKVNNLK